LGKKRVPCFRLSFAREKQTPARAPPHVHVGKTKHQWSRDLGWQAFATGSSPISTMLTLPVVAAD
jgi:hypothetical protein